MNKFVSILILLVTSLSPIACIPSAQSESTLSTAALSQTSTLSVKTTEKIKTLSPTNTPTSMMVSPTFTPLTASQQNKSLGRGINLGNALEAPAEGEWGVILQSEYFTEIAKAGFNSVRIPIRWSGHADKTPSYLIDSTFFNRIDWAINQALKNNLEIVLDFHAYDELYTNPSINSKRFLALWSQISTHYKDYSSSLVFEILNEPNGHLDPGTWNKLLVDALAVIRLTNPERNVIIGPGGWNSLEMLPQLKLPPDDHHIIVTFHYYNPFQFTHQGAEWVEGSSSWLGTKWTGSDSDEAAVISEFDHVAKWAVDNNRPIYMGEFGAYSKGDMDSRVRWTSFIARQAEIHAFSWSCWEFCSGFGVYDPIINQWRLPLRIALVEK